MQIDIDIVTEIIYSLERETKWERTLLITQKKRKRLRLYTHK